MIDKNANNMKPEDILRKYNSLKQNVTLDEQTHQRIKDSALNTLAKVRKEKEKQKSKNVFTILINKIAEFFSINRGLKISIAATFATVLIIIGIVVYYPEPTDIKSISTTSLPKEKTDQKITQKTEEIEIKKPKEKHIPIDENKNIDQKVIISEELAEFQIEKGKRQGFGFSSADRSDSTLISNKLDEFNSLLSTSLEFKQTNDNEFASEKFNINRNDSLFSSLIIVKYKSIKEDELRFTFHLNAEYPSSNKLAKTLSYREIIDAIEKMLYGD
jgi:hypothetical protein